MSRSTFLSVAIAVPILLLGAAVAIFAVVGFKSDSQTAVQAAADSAAADPNPDCTLVVPANPLTAAGLATPYQLTATNRRNGPCNEANDGQSAFVEAAIITPGGQLTLYDPVVVDAGSRAAAKPVPATVPAGSTVGIWFGFNGDNLTLKSTGYGNTLNQGKCVNGTQGSIFGQFAYCNGVAFFAAANKAIAAKTLVVPPIGTANDGLPCPTTRSFDLVDQDQSDNVVTHYLANAKGQIAQNNKASTAALGAGATDLANGSDNALLDLFMDPVLGCTPFNVADQSSDNVPSGSLPLDELSAAVGQQAPVALVPLNDPMTVNGDNQSTAKTNLYRVGVDQLAIGSGGDDGSGAAYCTNMFGAATGIQRVFKDEATFTAGPSVDPGMATNLFTFLAMRANQSFTNLGCDTLLKVPNPITLTMDANQIVTDATYTPLGQTPPGSTCGPTTTTTNTAPTTTGATTTTADAAPTTTTAVTTTAATPTTTGTTATTGTTTSTTGTAPIKTTDPTATTTAGGTTTTTGGSAPPTTTSAPTTTTPTCTPPSGGAPTSTTASAPTGPTRTNHPPNLWRWHHRPHW
ncbi:MAG TPA: hypothetical protein VHW44_10875 [Pseudonocardiaceae bacterium]|jgi:hypothetical protein|nr:hypothetical protein [Pseudonocardiaceae bacterium]